MWTDPHELYTYEKKLEKKPWSQSLWFVKTVTVNSRFYCCILLVELLTRNILVGPDLMYEIYYMCRELFMNCHGVLKALEIYKVRSHLTFAFPSMFNIVLMVPQM